MSQATQLTNLQRVDEKIRETEARLQEIEDTLNNDEALNSAQAALKEAEETLRPLKAKAKDLELELETTIDKAKSTEQRLYSGDVKNTKELEDMQMEIASLKSRQEQLEETTLSLMMDVDAAEETLSEREETLERTKSQRASQTDAMITERGAKQTQLEDLRDRRQSIRENIDEENLSLYDRLHKRTRGSAVAKMKMDGTCSKCGVQQNRTIETEIRRGNVAQCSNCQRILVF